MTPNEAVVMEYVNSILDGHKIACKENIQACKRFISDLSNAKFDFRPSEADDIVQIIEETFVLLGGEDESGTPFRNRPFLLQPWQKFIVFNLFGFYWKDSYIRRFSEALIFIPKKNGKTPLAAALAWAFGYKYAKSESRILLTSFTQQQSMYSFKFLQDNLEIMGLLPKQKARRQNINQLKLIDNNMEHSISGSVNGGKIIIQAFSGDPKDGLNGNFVIADEIHQYRNSEQYTYYQKAMKAYRNKLMLAITTAGEDTNSFCYDRLQTCKLILAGSVSEKLGDEQKSYVDDNYFIFITKADQKEDGSVEYLSPEEHEKANPGYGVTIMPDEILREANLAANEKKTLFGFLAKELNVYVQGLRAYFTIDKFQASDAKYGWTLAELSKLPIRWYGGVDLSKIKDLTAACLFGHYNGVDIIIPHAWFPITRALEKSQQDKIDLFGWQDDGWLDMCNATTIQQQDVVKWFKEMRSMGFRIKDIRYDRTFGDDFVESMRIEKFTVTDQPQLYKKTTKGFQRIDKTVEEGNLYYCGSEAFEYCVKNVAANEVKGGYIDFHKIDDNLRIDIFAAAVFAAVGFLETESKLSGGRNDMGLS